MKKNQQKITSALKNIFKHGLAILQRCARLYESAGVQPDHTAEVMEQRFLAETAVPEKTSWFSGEARGPEQGSQDPVEKISEIIEDEDLFGESRRN